MRLFIGVVVLLSLASATAWARTCYTNCYRDTFPPYAQHCTTQCY